MTDGLGGRTVTFHVKAETGSTLNMGWGYWNPNAPSDTDGKNGKWITLSLGEQQPVKNGNVEITFEMPEDATRMALEVRDYENAGGNPDKDTVKQIEVLT